jgi:hypothetical protein
VLFYNATGEATAYSLFYLQDRGAMMIDPQTRVYAGMVVGEHTRFRFFASSLRRDDRVGTMLEDVVGNDELEEVAPIETTLPATKDNDGKLVPVNLQAVVTEIGTLELRCLEKGGPGKWKLELNVRMKG